MVIGPLNSERGRVRVGYGNLFNAATNGAVIRMTKSGLFLNQHILALQALLNIGPPFLTELDVFEAN